MDNHRPKRRYKIIIIYYPMCFNLNLWSIVYMRGGGAESKKDIHIYIREINNLIIPRRSTRWYCKTHLFNWLYMAAAKTILQYFLNVSSFQLPVDPKTTIYTNEAHHTPYMKLMQLNASPPPKRGRLSFFLCVVSMWRCSRFEIMPSCCGSDAFCYGQIEIHRDSARINSIIGVCVTKS